MLERCLRGDALARLKLDHLLNKVNGLLIEVLTHLADVFIAVAPPLGECHFHLRKICKALPCFLARRAECPENLKDLSDLRVASK